MMREIKFRAWNIEEKIMCYSNEDEDASYWDGVYLSTLDLINSRLNDKYSKYEWLQYTGLKDKNGVEIYEGDILNSKNDGTDGADVWGYDDHYSIIVQEYDKYSPYKGLEYLYEKNSIYNFKYIEVIGNIYENKELINA